MIPQYEPLIPDARLARIEGRLRRDFPALSEKAQFVTFIARGQWMAGQNGIEQPVPDVAVLAISQPNPRHAGYDELTPVNVWFSTWREEEKANRHSSDIESDPAYRLYRIAVAAHLKRMSNLEALN